MSMKIFRFLSNLYYSKYLNKNELRSDASSKKVGLEGKKDSKTIWLHIGVDKTGTTALQNILYANESQLEESGVSYLKSGRRQNHNHHPLYQASVKGDIDSWIELSEELSSKNVKIGIVSFEGLYHLNEKTLRQIRDSVLPHDVKVLIYLRRQSDMVRSGIPQMIKGGGLYFHLLEKPKLYIIVKYATNYLPILNKFEAVFGKGSITVRRYEKKRLVKGDILHDFISAIGAVDLINISALKVEANHAEANSALELECLHAFSMLHDSGITSNKWRHLLNHYFMGIMNGIKSTFIDDEMARKIDNKFAKSNTVIANKWFGENTLFSEPSDFIYHSPDRELVSKYY